jgi:L-aminopeptidase/D-esterase-like protein
MSQTATLTPRTAFDSPYLEVDIPHLLIGCAEYDEGPTGCTIFVFPNGAVTAVDIRGGMVGQVEADYQYHHAICFAGGSLLGLEAVSGVRAALLSHWGMQSPPRIPLVGGAIIWDWFQRANTIYPDVTLGRAATASALASGTPGQFYYGRHGAGLWAGVGQGGAVRQIGPTTIAVFTVVNALGDIIDRDGNVRTRDHRHPLETLEERLAKETAPSPASPEEMGKHTTLTLVVTNQKWNSRELNQIGRQVHASMARAIQPFHTMQDGDILFTATTGVAENPMLKSTTEFGLIASELAWDAVLNSLAETSSSPGRG